MLPQNRVRRTALRLSRPPRTGLVAELAFYVAHEARALRGYEPDPDRLAAGGTPVSMAGGHESKHLQWYRAAQRLAHPWDPTLADAMRQRHERVSEEARIASLLADRQQLSAPSPEDY
jgi:hypothetical protein